MYSANFDYYRATSLSEAVSLLASHPGAKLLAGGHSLLPQMKLRVAQPAALVDIGRVAELRGIRHEGDRLIIGALTTHNTVATSAVVREHCPVLAEAASLIGDQQVRNRGTIGGSLAHADPASDMPAVMLALDAEFQLRSKKGGRRTAKAREFFQGAFTTAMTEDELLTDILIGGMGRLAAAYVSFDSAASGYALAGVCAVVARKRATISEIRVAITGVAEMAFLAPALERVRDTKCDAATLAAAATEALAGLDIAGDVHAPADYRRHIAQVAIVRAVETAYQRAGA